MHSTTYFVNFDFYLRFAGEVANLLAGHTGPGVWQEVAPWVGSEPLSDSVQIIDSLQFYFVNA